MTTRIPVGVFFALFTISGFAGLIYQSIWSHYLKLFLGHAAYAQTLVLAIFMGGMAIGSWLVSRYTRRIRNLLLGYAIAELGIGILALLFHRVFLATTGWAFDSVLPALAGAGVDAFKWTLASALILPASILLGTTFPLMSAGIVRLYPQSGGRVLSMLYFTNSFGAAIGVLASGFFLIDRFGLPGTILTAGLMNVLLALGVYGLAKGLEAAPQDESAEQAAALAGAQGRRIVRVVLLLAFATGAASFIYEITWIRMLSLGLGASTHAFEVMLAAFILAMSMGAFWARDRIALLRNDLAWLGGLLIAKAGFAAYAIWIYTDVLGLVGWVMQAVSRTDGGYVVNTVAGLVASMLVMFPAAFCAGMTLPLATHALTSRGFGEASIGKVYGANTAGCIFGAAFATHLGMEALGVKGLTGAGALLDAAVGVAAFAISGAARLQGASVAVGIAVAGALAIFIAAPLDYLRMSSGVYRDGVFNDPRLSKVMSYRDGRTATISVVDTITVRSIRTNGKPDASVQRDPQLAAAPDEATMLLAAALPLAIRPHSQDVANIGFGSGLTTHSLLGSTRLKRVDSIEIERAMVESARLFEPRNARAYADPRSHIHIEDAKTFFASSGRRYDIIVSEPSNPWVSGVSTLFSEEFYSHVKRYLRDDGLLVQWVQTYEIDLALLSTIFRALGGQFGDYAVFRNGVDLLVIATPGPKLPPLQGDVFDQPGLATDLAYLGYRDVKDLEALRVGGRAALEPLFLTTGFPANSDFFPILDQHAPRARFRNQNIVGLPNLRDSIEPVLALLDTEARTPLDRIQSAGVNNPARVYAALAGAEAVGVALGGDAANARALAPADRQSALLVHALSSGCRGAELDWLAALDQVARLALPALDAKAFDPLNDKVASSQCAKTLDEHGRRRLALLRAMNKREAAPIAEHATWLLDNPSPAIEAKTASYLATALAGHIALGRRDVAAQVRDRHLRRITPRDPENLALRLVLAHLAVAPRR